MQKEKNELDPLVKQLVIRLAGQTACLRAITACIGPAAMFNDPHTTAGIARLVEKASMIGLAGCLNGKQIPETDGRSKERDAIADAAKHGDLDLFKISETELYKQTLQLLMDNTMEQANGSAKK